MATFAEYQQQTMASNNDFPLYPNQQDVWNYDQTYLPTSTYADASYLNATTFDSYQTSQAFDPSPFAFDPSFQTKNLQPPSSDYSPANSASHSFESQHLPILSSTSDSGASVTSTISSAMGSPSVQPQVSNEWSQHMGLLPGIVPNEGLGQDFFSTGIGMDPIPVTDKACVDPSLIQPTFSPTQYSSAQYTDMQAVQSPQNLMFAPVPSPAPVQSPRSNGKSPSNATNYMQTQSYHPYQPFNGSRRPSISSVHSRHSQGSLSSEDSNKGLCPIATCGRHVKDLKAHMLTHQNERPEKCPIPTCEYHTKGFARKYDKNRHTLTHYKGTMVCGFCPGSGSAAEKSFNRADVFKRHLTSVHGVEQTPPNARRKSPAAVNGKKGYNRDTSGMCSTCGENFASAQDFYEHLDDCVLHVVQQANPSEAINEKILTSIADDANVQETMEKHMLPTTVDYNAPTSFDGEEEGDEEDDDDVEDSNDATYGSRSGKSGKGALKSRKNGQNSS